MKKVILTLALAGAAVVCANAQIIVGAGYDGSTSKSTYTSGSTSTTTSTDFGGFFVDATYNYDLGNGLGVQSGIGFDFLSKKEVYNGLIATTTSRYTGISMFIPILVNYKYQLNNDFAIGAYAGPQLSFALVSSSKTTNDKDSDVIKHNYKDDDSFNGFGLYATGGLFIEYAQKYRFTFGGYAQLNDANKSDSYKTKNNGLNVGFAYVF